MNVRPLAADQIGEFVAYCARHGREHDPSFLPAPDFTPGADDPTWLLWEEDGRLAGAASLLCGPTYRSARKGRFRIFHCLKTEVAPYRALLAALAPRLDGLDHLYLIARYSWCLKRRAAGVPDPVLPEGYALRPFRPGQDEPTFCALINSCFANLQGHLDLTPEGLARMRREPDHLEDGLLLLWQGDDPVGTVRVTEEEDEPGERVAVVGALGVRADHRGRGLGRALLRAGVAFGRNRDYESVLLSVNP